MKKSFETVCIEVLTNITGYEKKDILWNSKIENDLGLDSMMMLDLLQELSNTYPELKSAKILESLSTINGDITVEELSNKVKSLIGLTNVQSSSNKMSELEEVIAFNKQKELHEDLLYFKMKEGIASNTICVDDKELINYSTYNYLGTNGSEEITNSVTCAIKRYGTSVSGSRLLSGEIELHKALEDKIASFLGVDSAIVQVGGHSTNVNTIGNIVGEGDLILHDSLAHNSIIQGALLSKAKRKPFKHNDVEHLESELSKLRHKFNRILIIVEGVYSMDGDLCPLPDLVIIKNKYDAILMVDEAHSIGTIGKCGKGVTDYFGVDPRDVEILMGTLSKSLNSCGGYIAGNKDFIEYLKYNSPGFIFSVGITPSNAAAAYESICICEKHPEYVEKLHENSKYFLAGMKKIGINTGKSKNTPIIPMITGNSSTALNIAKYLFDNGINALPIIYPAVKEDEARLRFFISAAHTKENMDKTFEVLENSLVAL